MNIEPSQQVIEQLRHPEFKLKRYLLFVYGTMKRGHYQHVLWDMHKKGKYIRTIVIDGFKLLVDDYGDPIIEDTCNPEDQLKGELWAIDEEFKKQLDIIEMENNLREVMDGIYCYMPTYNVRQYKEVDKNSEGIYEWTKQIEVDSPMLSGDKHYRRMKQYEQHEDKAKTN